MLITGLQKALASLDKGLARSKKEPSDLEVRDACIQRFEYSYELSIKSIKRYIQTQSPTSENVDLLNFKDFLRLAAEIGLIRDPLAWVGFREARNNTSHAYDENKAVAVFEQLSHFMEEAYFLLSRLELGTSAL